LKKTYKQSTDNGELTSKLLEKKRKHPNSNIQTIVKYEKRFSVFSFVLIPSSDGNCRNSNIREWGATRECELICQIGVNPIQDEGHYVSLSLFKASVLGKFKLFYFLLLTSSKIMII